jgi:glutamate dehydrogenase (NAD(P)+)
MLTLPNARKPLMPMLFDLADDLGPFKIVHIWRPAVGLKAIVVIDNVACGPSIGGTRMASDVSLEECARLARAMTLKNAAAGLPHGGGKSVIFADPAMPVDRKETIMRAFAGAIADLRDYIPGPDMGTNETAMAWVHDEIGRAVGLPREIGGIPLDEIGATGYGLMAAAEAAAEFSGVKLQGARVAVQGFGAVGQHAAHFLAEKGSVLVAAADSRATVVNPDGIDVAALIGHKKRTGKVEGYAGTRTLKADAVVGVECDIWIPAARPDVLRKDNIGELKARLVLQGANIPATAEAEKFLHDKGIISVPDFIANAGGVICASVEYHGGSETMALAQIREKITLNTSEVLGEAKNRACLPREAADRITRRRVESAMSNRRWRS